MAYSLPILSGDEPVQDFKMSDGTIWRRTGYCCRCGECCFGDVFTKDSKPDQRCSMYEEQRDGTGMCKDRTEKNWYYHQGCNVFPQVPSQVTDYPSCTYKFTLVS